MCFVYNWKFSTFFSLAITMFLFHAKNYFRGSICKTGSAFWQTKTVFTSINNKLINIINMGTSVKRSIQISIGRDKYWEKRRMLLEWKVDDIHILSHICLVSQRTLSHWSYYSLNKQLFLTSMDDENAISGKNYRIIRLWW